MRGYSCRLCGGRAEQAFAHKVLGKHQAEYVLCPTCDMLQVAEPFWLEEAYQSPVSLLDTGIMARNIKIAQVLSVLIKLFFNSKGDFLDYAGGHGILVRLMRDYGFNFMWQDKYAENILARGFEYKDGSDIELLSLVECLEHMLEPITSLRELTQYSRNIFFTTEIRPSQVPDPDKWAYYCFATGQHISFYSLKSLQYLADSLGLRLSTDGRSFHILSEKKVNGRLLSTLIKASMPLSCIVKKSQNAKTMDDYFMLQNKL